MREKEKEKERRERDDRRKTETERHGERDEGQEMGRERIEHIERRERETLHFHLLRKSLVCLLTSAPSSCRSRATADVRKYALHCKVRPLLDSKKEEKEKEKKAKERKKSSTDD